MPRPERPGEGKELSPSVKNLADEIGLKMVRPDFIANSRPALEAAEYAREQGKFEEFHLAVFKAYWEYAKNIGQMSVLREIAASCGLNADEMERLLNEKRYAAKVERENQEAIQMGITGIPAYILGPYLIVGAQPYSNFKKGMELIKKKQSSGK
jgi:predicted DsbA family dithiol-disulfide isomerase